MGWLFCEKYSPMGSWLTGFLGEVILLGSGPGLASSESSPSQLGSSPPKFCTGESSNKKSKIQSRELSCDFNVFVLSCLV